MLSRKYVGIFCVLANKQYGFVLLMTAFVANQMQLMTALYNNPQCQGRDLDPENDSLNLEDFQLFLQSVTCLLHSNDDDLKQYCYIRKSKHKTILD